MPPDAQTPEGSRVQEIDWTKPLPLDTTRESLEHARHTTYPDISEEQKLARLEEFNLAMEEDAKAMEERVTMLYDENDKLNARFAENLRKLEKEDPELAKEMREMREKMRMPGADAFEIAEKLMELMDESRGK